MEKHQERPFIVRAGTNDSDLNPTHSIAQLTEVQRLCLASSAPSIPSLVSRVCSCQYLQQPRDAASRHGNFRPAAPAHSFLDLCLLLVRSTIYAHLLVLPALVCVYQGNPPPSPLFSRQTQGHLPYSASRALRLGIAYTVARITAGGAKTQVLGSLRVRIQVSCA